MPAKDKLCAARFQDVSPDRIPHVVLARGVEAKVLAGEIGGVHGPVETGATEPLYLDLVFTADAVAEIALPAAHNGFVYVYEGAFDVGEPAQSLTKGTVAVLSTGEMLSLAAGRAGASALVVAGRPLREPVAKYGPFVMNTQAEIHQAFEDFRAGRF